MISLKGIKFIDALGKAFFFELDAEDGIYSLVLLPLRRGVHRLCVNGETEVYFCSPKHILDLVAA
jgi:hypothetical protein